MFAFLLGFATINAEEIPDGIMPQRRQVVGTGVTSSSTPTTSPTQSDTTTSNSPTTSNSGKTTSSQSPSIPVTSTSADGTQTTAHVTSDSITSDKTTNSEVQTTKGTDNSVVKVGSTTIDPATLAHKTTVREPLVTKATKHQTLTSTWTNQNGQVVSSVYTTANVFESTTGFATATIAPSLANAGGDGSNLSTNTKKIIGGVVGGIGGAILIGGLAFVVWRLYGKKKSQDVQQDDLYSSDSLSAQKRFSGNTLDTAPYSNPNGAVNTASNF